MLPADILDFYLTQSPYAHSDKPASAQSIDLADCGWEKNELDRLMKWVITRCLHAENPGMFEFLISNNAQSRYEQCRRMGGQENTWLNSDGGVFCIKCKISVNERNAIKCRLTETYATCFFRHLRNSLAHGNYLYDQAGERVLFLDQASDIGTKNPAQTAFFQVGIQILRDLISLVKAGPSVIKPEEIAKCPSYRVERRVIVNVEEQN